LTREILTDFLKFCRTQVGIEGSKSGLYCSCCRGERIIYSQVTATSQSSIMGSRYFKCLIGIEWMGEEAGFLPTTSAKINSVSDTQASRPDSSDITFTSPASYKF